MASDTAKGLWNSAKECAGNISKCANDAKDSTVDTVKDKSNAFGQGLASLSQGNLNKIYGQDVSGGQKALLGIQAAEVITTATGAAKVIGSTGKIVGNQITKEAADKAKAAAEKKAAEIAAQKKKAEENNRVSQQEVSTNHNNLTRETNCSFRGDMEVRTINGYKSINEIQIGDMVWSKNEKTGLMGYQKVLHTMNSIDPDTTYVTITDSYGHSQQIVSDSLHPYFSSYGNDISPAKPSIGKEYHGDIKNAYWINAGDLKKGYKVLGSNGEWQVISEVYTVKTPLNSYNLEVNTDHTFFVKGIGGLDGVWVHNKDCWYIIPSEATTQTKNGQKIYTFEDRGRTVNVIENPEWSATGGKAKYFEVDADGKILNENEPNIHRATNRNSQNDSGQFVADPLHPKNDTGYNRPYLRTDTMQTIMEKYEKQANGDYKIKGTNTIIKAPVDIGHAAGFEHRRLEIVAEELNMSQAEFNEYVNSRASKFQLENSSVNRSHEDEMKGKYIPPELREDMTNFVNKLRGKK